MPHFPEHQKTVVIPVVWKEGKWEPSYGGEMPEIREGTTADLTLSAGALKDENEIKRLSFEKVVEILPAGSLLWARMSRAHYRGERKKGVPKGFHSRREERLEEAVLVPFFLDEPLKLLLRGTKPAQLTPCKCYAEDLPSESELLSVNQAYTRLSERFETTRRSHSGNVFTKVCFTDEENYILPLDFLRKKELRKFENYLEAQSDEAGETGEVLGGSAD